MITYPPFAPRPGLGMQNRETLPKARKLCELQRVLKLEPLWGTRTPSMSNGREAKASRPH